MGSVFVIACQTDDIHGTRTRIPGKSMFNWGIKDYLSYRQKKRDSAWKVVICGLLGMLWMDIADVPTAVIPDSR
jgi:hypothetical protein